MLTFIHTADIPVCIIAGNHDAASRMTRTLRLPDNVHLFPTDRTHTILLEGPGIAVHGQGFSAPAVKKNLAERYPDALPGYFNIGMLHTCATGREGHEPYAPCRLDDLIARGYHYWALGHVHQRETLCEDPPVIFPGNLQGRHIRETGPKGCMIVSAADDLFKPAAQKPAINAGLAELQKIRKAQREAQLPSQAWAAHDQALREATAEKTRIEADLERETRRRNRLMCIRDALPAMARRTELQSQYDAVKTAVLLPGDFGERHLSAVEALRIAESRQSRSENRIQAILRDLEGLTIPGTMIENSDVIETLFQEAGSIQKAAADRLRLEGLLSSARLEARERLRTIGRNIPLEAADTLRVEKPAVIRIQELTARYERLQARGAGIDEKIEKLVLRTERLKEDLAALPSPIDLGDLRQAITETAAAGDLESRHQALQAEVQRAETELRIALSRLPLWKGSPEALERLPLPSPETVDAFELRIKTTREGLEKQLNHEREALREALEQIHQIQAHLETLCREAGCDSHEELRAAEVRSETRRRIEGELERIEGHLRSLSAGRTLTAFIADAASVDPDTLDLQITRLTEEMTRLGREKSGIVKKIKGRSSGAQPGSFPG